MRVIAIGGVPACGKSTLVRHLIAQTTLGPKERFAEGVFGHRLPDWNAVVIGTYDDDEEMFPGTDKLSMAAQEHCETFLKELIKQNVETVFFEGDRLFNVTFLKWVALAAGLKIVMVEATSQVLKDRRNKRGSNQSAVFLKGRKTKVMNVIQEPSLRPLVVCLPNNTEEEHSRALAMLGKWIDPGQAARKRFS